MPNPYPIELRERAVRAYEDGTNTYVAVAAQFQIAVSTLCLWVRRARDTGHVLPAPKGGGWYSPVELSVLHRLVREQPDRTTEELTRAYNRVAPPEARVHRSSILRALQRSGYVFKKNDRARPSWIGPRSRPSGARSGAGSPR
jgi:transposase